jgi:hypothetical protein
MKPALFALAFAALAAGCARPAYVVKSDTEAARIRGRVIRIRETLFDVMDSRFEPNTHTVVEYNRAGNVTLTDTYKGPDSVYISRDEYIYDPSGTRMERHIRRDKLKNRFSETTYRYDAEGHLVREADGWHGWHADYTYDRHGYPRTRVDTTLNIDEKIRYRYDRLGRLKSERYRRGNGPLKRYTYHGDSDMVAGIRLGRTETDRYDERGDLVVMTSEVIEDKNRRGKITKSFPVSLTAEYEHDSLGNWVRRTLLYKGEVQNVTWREIDYYDE